MSEVPPGGGALAPATVAAYRETHYHVAAEPPFTLHIGEASAALPATHAEHGVSCSAFLTACNPYSQTLDDAANGCRQAALVAALEQQEIPWLPGVGEHPANGWPGEPSVLALGMRREAAMALGREHGQHAVVWSGANGVPELILLSAVHP
jgi:hypothetical protein